MLNLITAFLRWLLENDSAEQWMRDEGYLPPTAEMVAQDKAEEVRQKEIRRLSSYSD